MMWAPKQPKIPEKTVRVDWGMGTMLLKAVQWGYRLTLNLVVKKQTVLTTVLVRVIYDERSQGLIEPLNTYL